MATKRNKHGLSRHIPRKVKELVRRRCGFGCVMCGNAIITYEHFAPTFRDARKHDPAGITLLCFCHQGESTPSKRLLSKATITAADGNPYCRQQGYAQHMFDLGGQVPTLVLGTTTVKAIGDVLRINGVPYIQVHGPEPTSNRWRLSATFPDENGKVLCKVVENELQVNSGNFDFVQVANCFQVFDGVRSEVLRMELEPPLILRIVKFRWSVGGLSVEVLDRCPICSKNGATCLICSLKTPVENERRGWLVATWRPKGQMTLERCGFYSSTTGLQLTANGLVLGGES